MEGLRKALDNLMGKNRNVYYFYCYYFQSPLFIYLKLYNLFIHHN